MARRKAPAAAAVPVPAAAPEAVEAPSALAEIATGAGVGRVEVTVESPELAELRTGVARLEVTPAMRAHVRREILGSAAALEMGLADYHRQHPTWAALHVVMHDGSVDDRTVADCERTGQMLRHDVSELVRGLLALSEDERRALVARFRSA